MTKDKMLLAICLGAMKAVSALGFASLDPIIKMVEAHLYPEVVPDEPN